MSNIWVIHSSTICCTNIPTFSLLQPCHLEALCKIALADEVKQLIKVLYIFAIFKNSKDCYQQTSGYHYISYEASNFFYVHCFMQLLVS